jgi:hypothetical protein
MMKRWIVNAAERTVRDANERDILAAGEFIWTGTHADAMAAGARRRLAEEALVQIKASWSEGAFRLVGDKIEPNCGCLTDVHANGSDLRDHLMSLGLDVWREGSGLVVLGRL